MSKFNARAARAKRPCPLWVDAFLRDTTHLAADEIGAYMLLLMAMWTRESCDLPDDDARLARIARVSLRLWKSRVGPSIRPLLSSAEGIVFSKRLREEATYVERQVQQQSDRKTGEKPDNPPENNEVPSSMDEPMDKTTDGPPNHPSQQPNNPTVGSGGSACAREPDDHERILLAAGIDPTKDITGKWYGLTQRWVITRWVALGLTLDEILTTLTESRPAHSVGTLAYFDQAMQRAAGRKTAAPLQPIAAEPREADPPRQGRVLIDLKEVLRAEAARIEERKALGE